MLKTAPDITCFYCNESYTSRGITRHLDACDEREEQIDAANDEAKEQYHLKVTDQRVSGYQLHLEIAGANSLSSLDSYLRAIWLECCNHRSTFYVGNKSREEVKNERVEAILNRTDQLTYVYDFGSESRLLIEKKSTRTGPALIDQPVELMARNEPPEIPCVECEQPAEQMCWRCTSYFDLSGMLCEQHAQSHECGEELLHDVVNSPRLGICGYSGPAEPPY